MKGKSLRPKIASFLTTALISGLLVSIPVPAVAAACVPDSTTAGGDRVLTFSTVGNCDWDVPAGVTAVRVLVVGGGSSGGAGQAAVWWPQGGGGGAVVENTNFSITSSTIAVSVGVGGAAINTQGAASTSVNNGGQSRFGTITANGGTAPTNTLAPGGTSGNGNLGGNSTGQYVSGGGGGAGGAGNGTTGGVGINSNISGATVMYGSGGAGSSTNTGSASSGGGSNDNPPSANRGGGGSQPTGSSGLASAGAAGVVIIRYATTILCSPNTTSAGSDTVLTFTATGTCAWTPPANVSTFQLLVVGGGGSGSAGIHDIYWPAGGGGGAVVASNSLSVSTGNQITVSVGAGGAATSATSGATGNNGGSSSFGATTASGGSTNSNVATSNAGRIGGTSGNGNIGGTGTSSGSSCATGSCGTGGGGGAGGAGGIVTGVTDARNGGAGVNSDISGSTVGYGGGGAGGNGSSGNASHGGAIGYYVSTSSSATGNGAANRGGGGSRATNGYGGAGGSGVVIVRYSQPAGTSQLFFNANNGTGSDSGAFLRTGTPETLPSRTNFTRTGFEFLGWNTSANGSGTSYALGGAITASADTTLYAQWSRITNPSCAANVGKGGNQSGTLASTKAGNGCVAISFVASGVNSTVTFNYTGSDQSWTVPAGVTSATFYLFGAGGGGNSRTSGGGGGYATGAYSVTAGQVYTIIVGEGGGGDVAVTVTGLTGKYTKITYGGGGRGGSTDFDIYIGTFASGGGRSAIRAPGASTDLATAGGGGGGGYGVCGFGGGGLSGVGVRGGTQIAGGASAWPAVSGAAGNGSAYRGGDSNNEGGGGGGGYFGGGDGGNNDGGGGGSSYIALLTNGATSSGSSCSGALAETVGIGNIITYNANSATSGTVPNEAIVPGGTALTAATNTGTLARTNYTFSGWNTAANGSGTTYAVGSTTFIPTANTTLYAQWNSTITYNANGATSGTAPIATTAKGDASNTTLQSKGTLVRTGFNFSGWNTLADGSGTFFAAGASNYQSTGNVTLYAQWTASTGTPTLDSGSDTGNSTTDKLTKDNTPTINVGALVPGAVVTITATPATGTPVTCSFTASAAVSPATTSNGSCTFTTLLDGTYSFTVSQSYNGGASTASTALAGVVIDTVRPTITLTSTAIISGGNSLATPAAPSQNYNINAIFSKTVSGFVIGEITKNAESTGWEITTTALSTSALSSYTFNVRNATGAGNVPGKLYLSIAEGVATDAAGNTNVATTSNFIINTIIQLTLTNQYQAGINPVVGGNNATVVQSSNGASVDLTGQGGVTRANHTFAGWSLVTTNGSGAVIPSPFTPTVPLFLYSSWVADTYVVSYNANGGNGAPTAASQNYTFGSANIALTTKGTLNRTGYTFAGWNTLATGLGTNYLENASYKPTASIILYAKWTANSYTLTYNANGGTTGSTAVITAGTPLTLSTSAGTRAGYTLLGWNTAADGSGTSLAGATSQTYYSDVTLYALWRPVVPGAPSVSAATSGNTTATATVTGVAASGTTVGPATSYSVQTFASDGTTVVTGKTCTVLATASPLSCEITGLTNGTTYKFKATAINTTGSATGAASTVTATPAPYVVTYSLNGGTLATTTANYTLGTPLILPLPAKSGNSFTGWNNPSNASVGVNGSSYSPTATITLTAQWSPNTYTITYNGNGSDAGTVAAAGSFTFGNSYSFAAKGTMTKSGYTFAGWTTASNGTGTLYANATDSVASSAATYTAANNLTVYAKWTPQVYVVTYNANGATGSPSRATDSFTFGSTPLSLPDKTGMTYAGYTFVGWSETTSGAAVVNPYSPTQTRTLYAIWAGISYSVSYNANGGTGSVADATFTTGSAGITLNDGSSLSRTGYTFSGWKNVAGTTVSGSAYSPTDNVTVYAIWTPKTIAVTYDKGIATTTTAFPSNTTVAFGANLTLSSGVDVSTTISSTNYLFAGWAINGVTYKAGDTYRVNSEAAITVTAQWLRLFDVRYNVNGGLLATNDLATDAECVTAGLCIDGQVITLNVTPTRSGFTFNGWANQGGTLVTDSDGAIAGIQTPLSATNYIFYASWTANSYTITFAAGAGSNGNAQPITDSHGAIVQLAAATGYSLTGSVFTGWLIGSVTYPAGAFYTLGTDASPITATAQYANNTFKIFYNTNGATNGVTPAATTAVQGASISYNDATGFGRTGFTFDGWSDGTNVRAAGYATTMGSANATVIAQWKIAVPLTPTISSVTGSDSGATITVAPNSNGGAPSSYVVTASPGGATCTVYTPNTSCSISPLTNGTAYTFSVTATNSTGTSAAATSASVTPAGAPDAPTGVNAVRGNTQATVTFNPVTGSATGGPAISTYTITAYDANNNAVGTPCQASSSATSCVVTGLTNGTPYTFKATANNGLFSSSASAASNAAIPATVPNTPTSVSASVSTAGAATVSFTAPLNNGGVAITGYTVTASPGGFTCNAAADASSCVVTGLTNGTAYTFTVIATNEIGNSVASSATSAVTPQTAASAPTTITATAGDGQASVAFSGAVTNGSTIANYTVQAYDSNGNAVADATCTTSTSPCTVTGLANGSTYTFKVISNSTVYGAGSTTASAVSIASNAVTPATAPSAPTSVQVSPGTGKVTVSWTEPASNGSPITSYLVQAYDADGNAVTGATCTAIAPATTCDVSANLAAGSNYTFKVTATSAVGTSLASTASTTAAINAAPSVPLSVTAVAGNAAATVSWGSPANINGSAITGYAVTAYDANNNVAGTCTSVAPTTTCVVNSLTNGSPYTFKVTATNGIGTSSESLASTAVTPSTIPNAPTGVTAAMGDAQATISFLAPVNNGGAAVTSYTVTSNPGSLSCTVTAPATSCTVTGLTNGTAYTFTVKATNTNGDSLASTASTAGTPVLSSAPILVNPGQPTGNPYVGSTLTSNVTFSGSPTPTVTYQWKSCTDPADLGTCTDISGATSATFTPTLSELGLFIIVEATATNRIGSLPETSNPTLVIKPEIAFSAPSPVPAGTTGTAYVLSLAAAGGVGTFAYSVSSGTLPAGVSLDPITGQMSGTPTTAGTFTFTVRVTDANGVYKEIVVTITVSAQVIIPTCDAACVAANAAAAAQVAADRAAADRAAAEAIAKAAADKVAADAAAAAKKISDANAIAASAKATADAAAAEAAAKAAVDRAAAAAIAQAAADAKAAKAAADAVAARAAIDAAAKAAADAAAALKNAASTPAAKAAATKSANDAAAAATAAVKAAATAATEAAKAKTTATNATKQVDIAINSLNSKTAAAQASAQADAIAAAAKAAANAAATAAAAKATQAKATATAAQKEAVDTAARVATEQKQAADAAALAKIAADAAAKATAEKVAAVAAATKAAQDLAKVLAEKAALAEQAAKASDEAARAEIQKKIDEVTTKVEEAESSVEASSANADEAAAAQAAAAQTAEAATKEAQTQSDEVVSVKAESATKSAEASKSAAAAEVAAKVAAAAKAEAAKVPSKATPTAKPTAKPTAPPSKNSAKATVTGLKPGQKVKVTINVKSK